MSSESYVPKLWRPERVRRPESTRSIQDLMVQPSQDSKTSFGPLAPKLWRAAKGRERWTAAPEPSPGLTFGMKAPIVDFFGHDYITKFAPLEDILAGKADEIMEMAYKQDAMEDAYLPWTAGGYKFRWIHIPANNMVCLTIRESCLYPDISSIVYFPSVF